MHTHKRRDVRKRVANKYVTFATVSFADEKFENQLLVLRIVNYFNVKVFNLRCARLWR